MADLSDRPTATLRLDYFIPTYEQRLEECAEVIKNVIKAAPQGMTFKVIKHDDGSTLGGHPILTLETKVDLQ